MAQERIAERIVSAHNGRIEVESSEASGTTFTIHLPRHEKSKTDGKASSAAPTA